MTTGFHKLDELLPLDIKAGVSSLMAEDWCPKPRSVVVHRTRQGFGFTLRHFIVYPPESTVKQTHISIGEFTDRKRSWEPLDTIFVKQVRSCGPADQAGLRPGDRVVTVNGQNVTGKTYSQVISLIQSSGPSLYLVVVPRNEDIVQLAYYDDKAYNVGPDLPPVVPDVDMPDDDSHKTTEQSVNNQSADEAPLSHASTVALDTESHSPNTPTLRRVTSPLFSAVRTCRSGSAPITSELQQGLFQAASLGLLLSAPTTATAALILPSSQASLDVTSDSQTNESSSAKCTIMATTGIAVQTTGSATCVSNTTNTASSPLRESRSGHQRKHRHRLHHVTAGYASTPSDIIDNTAPVRAEAFDQVSKSPKAAKHHYQSGPRDSVISSPAICTASTSISINSVQSGYTVRSTNKAATSPPVKSSTSRDSSIASVQSSILSEPPMFASSSVIRSKPFVSQRSTISSSHSQSQQASSFDSVSAESHSASGLTDGVLVLHSSPTNKSIPSVHLRQPSEPQIDAHYIRSPRFRINLPAASDVSIHIESQAQINSSAQSSPNRLSPQSSSLASSRQSVKESSVSMTTTSRATTIRQPSYLTAVNTPSKYSIHIESSSAQAEIARRVAASTAANTRGSRRAHRRLLNVFSSVFSAVSPPRDQTANKKQSSSTRTTEAFKPPETIPESAPTTPTSESSFRLPTRNQPTSLSLCSQPSIGGGDTDTCSQLTSDDQPSTPSKLLNIEKLKSFFGERTPRIVSATGDKQEESAVDSSIVRQGWLRYKRNTDRKKSGRRNGTGAAKNWKPCYAVLIEESIFLLKDKKGPTVLTDNDISVPLKSALVNIVYGGGGSGNKRRFIFRLTAWPNEQQFLLQASSEEDMLDWVTAIRDCAKPGNKAEEAASSELLRREMAPTQTAAVSGQMTPPLASITEVQDVEMTPVVEEKAMVASVVSVESKELSIATSDDRRNLQIMQSSESVESTDQFFAGMKNSQSRSKFNRVAHVVKSIKRFGSTLRPEGAAVPTRAFGVSLTDTIMSPQNECIPLVVALCCDSIENRGLDSVGIYRVPGNNASVTALQDELKYKGIAAQDNARWHDVNVVSSLLKSFFRKLPNPITTFELYPAFIESSRIADPRDRLLALKNVLHELPLPNFTTLSKLSKHLNLVSTHKDNNKVLLGQATMLEGMYIYIQCMDTKNLAIVFGPTLVRTEDTNVAAMVKDMSDQCRIVDSFIRFYEWLFSPLDSPGGRDVPAEVTNDISPLTSASDLPAKYLLSAKQGSPSRLIATSSLTSVPGGKEGSDDLAPRHKGRASVTKRDIYKARVVYPADEDQLQPPVVPRGRRQSRSEQGRRRLSRAQLEAVAAQRSWIKPRDNWDPSADPRLRSSSTSSRNVSSEEQTVAAPTLLGQSDSEPKSQISLSAGDFKPFGGLRSLSEEDRALFDSRQTSVEDEDYEESLLDTPTMISSPYDDFTAYDFESIPLALFGNDSTLSERRFSLVHDPDLVDYSDIRVAHASVKATHISYLERLQQLQLEYGLLRQKEIQKERERERLSMERHRIEKELALAKRELDLESERSSSESVSSIGAGTSNNGSSSQLLGGLPRAFSMPPSGKSDTGSFTGRPFSGKLSADYEPPKMTAEDSQTSHWSSTERDCWHSERSAVMFQSSNLALGHRPRPKVGIASRIERSDVLPSQASIPQAPNTQQGLHYLQAQQSDLSVDDSRPVAPPDQRNERIRLLRQQSVHSAEEPPESPRCAMKLSGTHDLFQSRGTRSRSVDRNINKRSSDMKQSASADLHVPSNTLTSGATMSAAQRRLQQMKHRHTLADVHGVFYSSPQTQLSAWERLKSPVVARRNLEIEVEGKSNIDLNEKETSVPTMQDWLYKERLRGSSGNLAALSNEEH